MQYCTPWLDARDLGSLACASQEWQEHVDSPWLWRPIVRYHGVHDRTFLPAHVRFLATGKVCGKRVFQGMRTDYLWCHENTFVALSRFGLWCRQGSWDTGPICGTSMARESHLVYMASMGPEGHVAFLSASGVIVRYTPQGALMEPVPSSYLTSSIQVTGSGSVFSLRDGTMYQNDTPLTSDPTEYSFFRHGLAWHAGGVVGAAEVAVVVSTCGFLCRVTRPEMEVVPRRFYLHVRNGHKVRVRWGRMQLRAYRQFIVALASGFMWHVHVETGEFRMHRWKHYQTVPRDIAVARDGSARVLYSDHTVRCMY